MKYIGIDYGRKRIGVAISDEDGSLAFPEEIVDRDKAKEQIVSLSKSQKISGIVIGQSITNSGEDNDIVKEAEVFAKTLEAKTKLPIFWEREDFSSVEAHRYQTKAGARDDSAAAIILQRFLDKKRM